MTIDAYAKTSQPRVVGDEIKATRLEDFNTDLAKLFAKLDARNLSCSYDWLWFLTSITDNLNSITVNIDWTDWNSSPAKLYFQEVWDTKKFTVTYNVLWLVDTVLYA